MDLKDSKTQKIGLGILAFFIIVYFWYTRVYSIYDDELTVKKQEFETISSNLTSVTLKAKSLDALKEEYKELLARYREIEELLPEVQQIPSFLFQLHTASSLTGTKITRVQPLPLSEAEFYKVASFEIELTGTCHDFGTFISYVANFPFIANISDVDVKAVNVALTKNSNAKGDTREGLQELARKETITATFTLSTYFVKENERLRELVL